ncbi:MAG TPA: MFS transporter, partial [Polyangiaceae bacterium]|nr:MFS transporter [Polyangiaceae bacterium]
PAAGSVSDLFGRKRVLVVGLVGFGAASLLCALAPSLAFLIVARGLQGAAGALLVPSSLALVVANFTGSAQTRAIATWTAWSGISTIAGPLLGGALVDAASWRWVFAINVLPIAVTLGVVAALEREHARERKRRVDLVGASLCVLGLGGVTFGLIELPLRGAENPAILLSLGGGTLALVAFVVCERKARDPMVDLELFRRRNFAVGNAATLAIYAGLGGVSFLVSVFLQQVAGYSATAAGLALMPVTAMLIVLSPVAGRLAEKYGPRWFMAAGPLTAAGGAALMTRIGAEGRYVSEVLPGVLLFGAGLSMTVAPLTAAVLGDVDERQAGVGSAVNNSVARLASLLAIAAVGALAATRFGASLDEGASRLGAAPDARAFLDSARNRPFDASVPPRLGPEVSGVRSVLARASVAALHAGLWATAALLAAGGTIAGVGITNRQRRR